MEAIDTTTGYVMQQGSKERQTVSLINGVSSLQTKLSHRERHEARRVGLEAIPLNQHIEGGHGER
jgi:hypothetical protein